MACADAPADVGNRRAERLSSRRPPHVKSLADKKIKVSGCTMPLGTAEKRTHIVLLAYPPDRPFHLSPAPMQFMEGRTETALPFDYDLAPM